MRPRQGIFLLLCLACMNSALSAKKMKQGIYRAVLTLDEKQGIELPFNFELKYEHKKPVIVIHNASERITVDEITVKGDSVIIKMPVFDTEFKCKIVSTGLEGVWINHYRSTKNIVPFKAIAGESFRFAAINGISDPIFNGHWETTFSPGKADSSKAIGVFQHEEQTDLLTGTFLTETGDYRYLEGIRSGNTLELSAFDGSHAYLFTGELNNGMITGKFYSGSHYVEDWIAKKNPDFKLPDAEEITFVKDPSRPLYFAYKDLNDQLISLTDDRFANKPVIVQLMGSWCPNCMDESRYLAEIYRKYQPQGLEIVALAFEKTTDPEKVKQLVTRMRDRLGIEYPILLPLQMGKDKAGEVLPDFNKISAFPTTIYLNRQHQVMKVHTGFSGPATVEEYQIFRQRSENLIKSLLKN